MAGPSTVFGKILSPSSLHLGMLITTPADPLKEFLPAVSPPTDEISVVVSKVLSTRNDSNSTRFGVFLTSLLTNSLHLKTNVSVDISAASATLRTLPNSRSYFSNICKDEETRKWVESQIEYVGELHLRLYLIVGLHTLTNVKFTLRRARAIGQNLELTVPITALFGDPGLLGGLVNPGASVGVEQQRDGKVELQVDECIWAVQLRRVKFNWFSSKKIEDSFLDRKTVWKVMLADRGEEDEDEVEDDVLEMVLEEGPHSDDSTLPELFVAEDGTVYHGVGENATNSSVVAE